MLRSVSRLGSCARAAIAPFLASLALAPAVAAPVGQTLASTPLPAEINDAHTLAIDPAGQLWVIDTGQHRLHRLTRSGTNSDLNLDLNAVSPGALDVDAGPDGQFYITDPGTGVWVLNRGLVSDGLLFTPSDIGASAIDEPRRPSRRPVSMAPLSWADSR
jgi:streptogramin lyase